MSQPLPLRALNHISRVCRDVQATAAFYRDILGFLEVKRPSSFDFEGAWLFNYGIGVHLIAGEPPARQAKIDPKSDHLSFQADSLEEVETRLRTIGFEYAKTTIEEGGVQVTQLFFHDPENNMIEICNCDQLPVVPLDTSVWCPSCVAATLNSPACGSRPMQTGSSSQDEEEELDQSDRSSDSYMSAEPERTSSSMRLPKCISVTGCMPAPEAAACTAAWAAGMSVSTPHTGIRRSCSMSTLCLKPSTEQPAAVAGFRSPSVLLRH